MSGKKFTRDTLINKRFGDMVIVDVVPLKGTSGRYNQDLLAICKCDCGNIFEKSLVEILYKRTKEFRCEECNKKKLNEKIQLANVARRKYAKGEMCKCCHSRPIYAKGMCKSCYSRYLFNGRVEPTKSVEELRVEKRREIEERELKKLQAKEARGGFTQSKFDQIEKVKSLLKEMKLSKKQRITCELFISGKPITEIAKELNVSRQCVSDKVLRTIKKYENLDAINRKKAERLEAKRIQVEEVQKRKELRKAKFYEIQLRKELELKRPESRYKKFNKKVDASKLNDLEQLILKMLTQYNYNILEISDAFETTPYIIRFHVKNMLEKMG